jgi:hypothetical protein
MLQKYFMSAHCIEARAYDVLKYPEKVDNNAARVGSGLPDGWYILIPKIPFLVYF